MEYCSKRSLDTVLEAALRDPQVGGRRQPEASCLAAQPRGGVAGGRRPAARRFSPCLAAQASARGAAPLTRCPAGSLGLSAQAARSLPWDRLLAMAVDAANGMLYLHTRDPPIAHRDLKSVRLMRACTVSACCWPALDTCLRLFAHQACAAATRQPTPPLPPGAPPSTCHRATCWLTRRCRSRWQTSPSAARCTARPSARPRWSWPTRWGPAAGCCAALAGLWQRRPACCLHCIASTAARPPLLLPGPSHRSQRWLAPEVLGGEPGQLPADVWAYGTIL